MYLICFAVFEGDGYVIKQLLKDMGLFENAYDYWQARDQTYVQHPISFNNCIKIGKAGEQGSSVDNGIFRNFLLARTGELGLKTESTKNLTVNILIM